MLKYYVRRSIAEGFQRVETPPASDAWIHGDLVTEGELITLADKYDMNRNILRDVLDHNELPRVEVFDDAVYVFVRMAQRGKRGKVTTTPILLVAKEKVFASISTAMTPDIKAINPGTAVLTMNTSELMLGTVAAVITEYEELMQRTSRYIHDTTARLKTHEVTNEDFIKFVTVEGNLNEYAMNLNGMLVVAERLRDILRSPKDVEAVDDIILYIKQLVVSIKSYRQSITSIRNAYGTIANNVLNRRMKTLTVLTVLIALPNVFYGMYGMNVDLPFQDFPWAYGAIVSISLIVIALVFLVGRKRGTF